MPRPSRRSKKIATGRQPLGHPCDGRLLGRIVEVMKGEGAEGERERTFRQLELGQARQVAFDETGAMPREMAAGRGQRFRVLVDSDQSQLGVTGEDQMVDITGTATQVENGALGAGMIDHKAGEDVELLGPGWMAFYWVWHVFQNLGPPLNIAVSC